MITKIIKYTENNTSKFWIIKWNKNSPLKTIKNLEWINIENVEICKGVVKEWFSFLRNKRLLNKEYSIQSDNKLTNLLDMWKIIWIRKRVEIYYSSILKEKEFIVLKKTYFELYEDFKKTKKVDSLNIFLKKFYISETYFDVLKKEYKESIFFNKHKYTYIFLPFNYNESDLSIKKIIKNKKLFNVSKKHHYIWIKDFKPYLNKKMIIKKKIDFNKIYWLLKNQYIDKGNLIIIYTTLK